MIRSIFFREGLKMLARRFRVKREGFRRYTGDDKEVCRKILEDCWDSDKKFYKTSAGHFNIFYTRDFSFCAEPLVFLGKREEVMLTLGYALSAFNSEARVRVAISRSGKPFDFPCYAIDSLPLLLRALRTSGALKLAKRHSRLIEADSMHLYERCIDKSTGLVRKDLHFSSIKDHSKRKSSCYDNCMLGMLSADLDYFRMRNPFKRYDYRKTILGKFWNGSYFLNDLSRNSAVTGDSNIFPFWTGLFSSKKMLGLSLSSLVKAGLASPFALKYHDEAQKHEMNFYSLLAPGYETSSVWSHLGMIFIDMARKADPKLAKKHLRLYQDKIMEERNFLELHDGAGRPYLSALYCSDESMLWAAMYLKLKKKLYGPPGQGAGN